MSGDPRKRPDRVPHPNTKSGAARAKEWEDQQKRRERERELRQIAAHRRQRAERFPAHAVGLMDISSLSQLQISDTIISAIESHEWLFNKSQEILEEISNQHEGPHRNRAPGNQIYAYIHFVMDGRVNIEPWWSKVPEALWRRWGFEIPEGETCPAYIQIYRRLCELERFWERIRELAEIAIAIAAKEEPRIGQLQMTDGTEQITSAALFHVCEPGKCPTGRAGERVGGIGQQPRGWKLNAEDATDHRHAAEQHPRTVDMEKLVRDESLREVLAGKIDQAYVVPAEGRKPARMRFRTTSGHWWETRDMFAGVRYYAGKNGAHGKFWHGKLQVKVVDHFTGAPLAIIDIPAGANERESLIPLMRRVCDILGYGPSMLTTDSGHWFDRDCSIPLQEMGIQHVGGDRANYARDEHVDEMGGVRCEHCNGPAEEIEYDTVEMCGRYRCLLKLTDKCSDRFRKSAKDAPRLLGPIPATTIEHQYARECHHNKENAQRTHRSRYESANKHYDHIPRRISPFVQTLRAQMGLVIEWVRICLRMGIIKLDGFTQTWDGRTAVYAKLIEKAEQTLAKRSKLGLQVPFGPKAAELGFGLSEPPPPPTS